MPQPYAPVPGHGGAIPLAVQDLVVDPGGEPRIPYQALAQRLGYAEPRYLAELIARHRAELATYGSLVPNLPCGTAKSKRGRPAQALLLNEGQAVLLAILSRTPVAAIVRRQVIELFMAWRADHSAPVEAAPPGRRTPRSPVLTLVAEADPVALALAALLPMPGARWSGSASALLRELGCLAGSDTRVRDWPRSSQEITGRLARLGPALRAYGIMLSRTRTGHARTLHLERHDPVPEAEPWSPPPRVPAAPSDLDLIAEAVRLMRVQHERMNGIEARLATLDARVATLSGCAGGRP